MQKRRYVTLLALLALVSWLLVACGADTTTNSEVAADEHDEGADHHDEDNEDGHEHGSHVEEHEEDHRHTLTTHESIDGADEIRVVAKEWGFEPASVHLHEGEAINIVLVNEGALEHEIELEAFEFHIHAQPGETVTAGFVPEKTGEFEFACFVPGHYDAGMVGEAVVEHAH